MNFDDEPKKITMEEHPLLAPPETHWPVPASAVGQAAPTGKKSLFIMYEDTTPPQDEGKSKTKKDDKKDNKKDNKSKDDQSKDEAEEGGKDDDKDEDGDKDGDGGDDKEEMPTGKKRMLIIGAVVLVLVGGTLGLLWWLHARNYENTDDAFIDTHMVRTAPQVPGRVLQVMADDNQLVHAGDQLIQIDPADYEARLAQAEASEAQAEADLEEAKAEIAQADANATNAEEQLDRNEKLVGNHLISNQQLDTYVAQARSTAATLLAAEKKAASAEANIKSAQAQVNQAHLNLSYTKVYAAEDGHVTSRNVQIGDYIQAGQNILDIVPLNIWVTANYKETQLDHMRPGQQVEIEIDAYPDKKFHGHVDSIQSGGGGAFSLLPPENSTGNYVKIVQRVPVKIVFDGQIDQNIYLGPGMSVVPSVTVR